WASRIRRASETSRKSSPSPSKLQERPLASTSSVGSRSRYNISCSTRPVLSLYVTSNASEPYHLTASIVTAPWGESPLTTAPTVSSSSRAISPVPPFLCIYTDCHDELIIQGNSIFMP